MKKLMIVAAAVCGAVMAHGVESANIVGYQNITLESGFSFFTPTFKAITGGSLDIQNIKCLQADGSEWLASGKGATKCAGAVSLQKVDSTGRFGTEYSYYSTLTPAGWYSDNGTVYAEGVTFAAGEGFIVQNIHTVGAKLLPKAPVVQ